MLRPAPNPEALIESALGAADAQDRRFAREGGGLAPSYIPAPETPFDRFTPEQRSEWGRKGGLHTPRRNAAARYGFTPDEFDAWGRIIAKGFGSDEAAEIVLRSRRSSHESSER